MIKTEQLLKLKILKRKPDSIDTEFVLINPLTYIYLSISMTHIGFLYLKNGKNFQL